MMNFATLFDKAFAAYFFCTFLFCTTVNGRCPAVHDQRSSDCRAAYTSLADGNLTRTLDEFAGQLKPAFCIAHCGCKSKSYAAIDSDGNCFCGNVQGSICSNRTDCQRVYATAGIPASPSATFPSKMKLFDSGATSVSGLSNAIQFAVANEGKLSYFTPSAGSVAFVETGERKVSVEIEGYWGCRTPDYTVNVYSNVIMSLVCPNAVRKSVEFFCWATISDGSGIQTLDWLLDNSQNGAQITSVAEPLVLATGGNMTVDRFEKLNASCDYNTEDQTTFINLNYEFTAIGQVKAFEAHITKTGEIRFQIFRPMCDHVHTEKTYCHSQRKCVSTGCGTPSKNRGNMEFYPPSSKPVFCPDVERFKVDDNSTCPHPEAFSLVQADYQLLFEYVVNVTQKGNAVIKVPADKNFTVYPGDVLGFTTGCSNKSADIGFYSYDTTYELLYPEYKYTEVAEINPDAIYSRKLPTASIFKYFHLLRAHTVNPTNYLKQLKFDFLELQHTVSAKITAAESTVTRSAQISVQNDVTSFVLSASVTDALINGDITFSVSSINTEVGVSYQYHFGETAFNGTFERAVSTKSTTKRYATPGIYTVICRAANLLSHVDKNITVYVYAPILQLDFTKEVDPKATGEFSTSTFVARGSGNATVTYILGDNSADRVLNVTLADHVFFEVTYKYATQGDYLITVNAKHPLRSETIKQYATVEDIIKGVAIIPPGVVATNFSHNYGLTVQVGTNLTHVWDWEDGTPNDTSPVNSRNMTHTYTTYGNRTITVYTYNLISNFTCTLFVEIQDIIKGLNFTQPVHSPSYIIMPTNQSAKSEAWFVMEQGTGVDIYVDWDVNNPNTRLSPKAYDRDKTNDGGFFVGNAIHQYLTIKTYNVTVFAKNEVSEMSITTTAIYEAPITAVSHTVKQQDLTTNYIEVNESVCFTVQRSGTNILMKCDFNDKYTEPVITSDIKVCKSWTHWHLPFNVTITLYNNVSSHVINIPVDVQMPVHNFTNLRISGGPENTTERMELLLQEPTGDFFNCTWTIKDTTTVVRNLLYTNFLTDGVIGKMFIDHQFKTPGVYDVEVFCKNRLYSATAKTNVSSYQPATDFDVAVLYGGVCGSKKVAGSKGDGPDLDMFAFGCPLRLTLSKQGGSNITNTFVFGDGSDIETSDVTVTHTYAQTSESTKKLIITASNPTSSVRKEYTLKFLPRITGLKIGNNGPVKVGKPMSYNVTVEQKGLDSCFLVDCESGRNKDTMEIEHKTFWMGVENCQLQTKYKGITYKPDLDPAKVAVWGHTFQSTGKFKCTVTGENSVSLETATTEVTVLDKPCNKPKVEFNDISVTIGNPANMTRGKNKVIASKVTKDCEKTQEIEYKWNITLIKADGGIVIIKSINHTDQDSALKIPARTLEYGLYGIELKVCMKVFPPVCTSIMGYVKVNPTPMVAQFEGGSGRAAGKDKMIKISATPSHDPDTSLTIDKDMKISFFCKRQAETFPDDLDNLTDVTYPVEGPAPEAKNSSLNVTSDFKGCFGNGMGRLREFEDQSSLQINSSFMPLKQYFTIRMRLSKPSSLYPRQNVTADFTLFIVPGDPPEISISCIVNCGAKKNPDKPFKLLAVCKKYCNTEISYVWSMQYKNLGEPDSNLKPAQDFGSWLDTEVTQKNLVMKTDKMVATKQYRVKLTGFLVGFAETYGFSLYDIKVNIRPKAPDASRCRVLPTVGKPFEKVFQVFFSGFEDEDMPLKYFADYRVSPTGKWTNFYQSLSKISDKVMFPAGQEDGKVEVRFYCEDAFRATSDYVYKVITVKRDEKEEVDLSNVIASSQGATDPAAASQVANAVLDGMGSDDGKQGDVVGAIVDLMDNVQVNSPEGALALSKTMSSCMDTGGMSAEKQAKAMKAMAKCAEQMGPDTPADIVNAVATGAMSVILKGVEGGSGNADESDEITNSLGARVASNMVDGEKPFVQSTGKSMIQCQAMDPGGNGAVALGSGGGFDMDSSELGEPGAPLQAVGGNGPDKFSNKSSSTKDVTSDLVSLELASAGKAMKVQNLTKPIVVKIKQPINPYLPEIQISYTHLLKVVNVVNVPGDNESSVFIEINNKTEMNDSCFFVIIKKGSKPKLYDNDFNYTLPHIVHKYNPDGSNKTAKQLKTEQENRFRIFLHGKKELNGTAIGTYYVAVLNSPCNTTNVTLPIMSTQYQTGPLNITIPPINFTFSSYTGSCKFFNKTSKTWSSAGLEILPETSQNFTHCATTHLSSFAGGSVFAKPNTIDFSKAFAGFSNIGENPTVFATTLSIIGIYFLLLAYCRYKDKKDLAKIEVYPLEDNHPSDNYLYEIGVQTGFVKGAGTTAEVFIILNGSLGETSPRKLKNPNRSCFNKGDTDSFLLSTPFSLGNIKSIEVWHNNTGNSPGWYCMQVQVRDTQSDKKFIFVCNRWLAVEEDDGLIKRKVDIATKDDLVQFDFLFAQTARKNLYDGHIWFSVFTRPPRSHFTRCQRLGCCLTLLLTSMLANAMFYKDPAPASNDPNAPKAQPSDSIHLGPITISIEQIKIGFTSSLVVVPVNLIIATLFQKAKPKEDKKDKKGGDKYKADGEEDEESAIGSSRQEVSASKIDLFEREKRMSVDMTENDQEEEMDAEQLEVEKSKKRANFIKMLCMPGNDDEEEENGNTSGKGKKKPKPKASLPHWVIYIAYILIFMASGTAAFFVILYGFQFGKEKSDNWMKSMMLSFWQSVLVIQPVKVLALSVLVAMIIKDPKAASGEDEGGAKAPGKDEKAGKKKKKKVGENGEELDEEESEEEEEEEENKADQVNFKLPDEKSLEESRQLRLKEKKMKAIIREIVIHLLFVMLCLFIGYSNMNPFAVGFGTSVKTFTGAELQKVTRVEEYWKWIDKTFIPYLYPGKWYNGIAPYKHQFVADTEPSKIIAMGRMRQLRVKKNTCTKHPVFENIISECNGLYSWSNEDTEQYSAGWKPPLNKTETRKLRHRKRKALWLGLENAWQHQSVLKLKNFPFLGNFGTYSGSSYAVSIGPDERISRLILKNMKDNFWIDRYTRAIFHELNIYNANTNLMMIFTLVSEILNTGGWNYFDNVQAIRLYRWQGGIGGLIAIADLVFMIVTLVGLYKLVKKCRKEGVKNYLKSAWNFLHAFVTVFSICTFACVFARVGAVMWAMKQYKNDPEVFVSFAYLGQLDYFVSAFIGFVVMATNLEFLRLLRFNKKIGLLTATIRQSMKPLASFGIIFAFIFLSYVSLAHLLFVSQLEDYKNFGISVVSLTRMFLGQFDVESYRQFAPFLGPMLFFTYMVAIQMVLINMFIGIICETFEEVRLDIEKQSNDHEIVSFMTNRFKKIAGAAVGPSVDPIYREWKSDWEVTMDSIDEKCESIVYLMRNVEAEEVRQNNWFEPTKANDKKKNVLAMVVGSDEFTYENELLDTIQLLDKKMKKMTVEKSQKMLYAMAKKKKKDREEELREAAKSQAGETSIFSEDESDEETSDDNEE